MMLGAILVQHTRWENAVISLARLQEAGLLDPPALAAETPERLVPLLNRSGFMMAKGRACIALAQWTVEVGGETGMLEHLDDAALRASLLGVTGVGPETADVIALYAFDRGVFVADAYAWRLLTALGLDAPRPYEALRRHVGPLVAEADLSVRELQELHGLIDEFGRLAARDAALVEALRVELGDALGSGLTRCSATWRTWLGVAESGRDPRNHADLTVDDRCGNGGSVEALAD
jgi:endonuclease-3 related protein